MIIDTGFRLQDFNKDVPYPDTAEISAENSKGERRISEGDNMRAMTACKRMDHAARNKLHEMNKALLVVAGKKQITRQIPDDEVGESDLPKGKLKYDEVPDAANMLGQGGPGKVVCTELLSTGRGMISNTIFGNEMMRTLIDANKDVKERTGGMTDSKDAPSRNVKNKAKG